MAIKVNIPGVLTTIQDNGRVGFQKSGMTGSGVMDACAYRKGNYLVGNKENVAVLELTLYGGEYEFTEDAIIALTGADMTPSVQNVQVPMNKAIQVKVGDVLKLGAAQKGCRTYLAVSGGIDVPLIMNSRSTNLQCKVGGFCGRPVRSGDELPIGSVKAKFETIAGRKVLESQYPEEVLVHVIPGPQEEYFTKNGISRFYSESYEVTDACDRMGYRLNGARVESVGGTDIVSDGIVYGSIQIPASGKPIILMADHQTTGGYAKIGTICQADLWKVAQCRPGNHIKFKKISVKDAQKLGRSERKAECF